MNDLAFEILHLAETFVEMQTSGRPHAVEEVGRTLCKIVRLAAQAHEDYTGQPLDPALIHAEEEL